MGAGRWDANSQSTYDDFTTRSHSKTREQVFSSRGLRPELDPKNTIRESRDSAENPNSTPVIVALDVTGSMGFIAEALARKGLGTLFTQLLDQKPVPDPHVMFMAIGDVRTDQVPLQVSQFEADARIIEQLAGIYLEGNGGGNQGESYPLAWYYAGAHTRTDAYEKRGKKGYLFTVGDEPIGPDLLKRELQRVFGDEVPGDATLKKLFEAVSSKYEIFHVVIEEGSFCRGGHGMEQVMRSWNNVIGERVLRLSDHTKLAELVISAIAKCEGTSAVWTDPSTARIVDQSLQGVRLLGAPA